MRMGPGTSGHPRLSPGEILRRLYEEDRREHAAVPPVGTAEYSALRNRDRARRQAAAAALAELEKGARPGPEDLYHAAWLYNHGETPAEALQAHRWALAAAELGHRPARWLSAAAYDRWCMYQGRVQKYGTQFVPDGVRYRLWDVDPDTSDAGRAEWDVPTLAEQERRAEEMSAREAQPDLDPAPSWLNRAIRRWSAG